MLPACLEVCCRSQSIFQQFPPIPYNKSFINLSLSLYSEECISHLLMSTAFHPALRSTLISESPREKKRAIYQQLSLVWDQRALLAHCQVKAALLLPVSPCLRVVGGVWVVLSSKILSKL